jgi:hypothetical protein
MTSYFPDAVFFIRRKLLKGMKGKDFFFFFYAEKSYRKCCQVEEMQWILIQDDVQSFFFFFSSEDYRNDGFSGFWFHALTFDWGCTSYIFPPGFITSNYFENYQDESDVIRIALIIFKLVKIME